VEKTKIRRSIGLKGGLCKTRTKEKMKECDLVIREKEKSSVSALVWPILSERENLESVSIASN